jgi:hypothetical protein
MKSIHILSISFLLTACGAADQAASQLESTATVTSTATATDTATSAAAATAPAPYVVVNASGHSVVTVNVGATPTATSTATSTDDNDGQCMKTDLYNPKVGPCDAAVEGDSYETNDGETFTCQGGQWQAPCDPPAPMGQ